MESVKICEWCMQPFHTKRSHSRTCSGKCRLALHKLETKFSLLKKGVSENDVETFYAQVKHNDDTGTCSHLYLRWYRVIEGTKKKRFCDVYVSKQDCCYEQHMDNLGWLRKKKGTDKKVLDTKGAKLTMI